MKTFRSMLACALMALVAFPSFAADVTVSWHMYNKDRYGVCGQPPTLLPQPTGHTGRAILRWVCLSPATSGADSLSNLADGALATFTLRGLPDGTYNFRAYQWDAGGYGCDTTLTRVLTTPDTVPPGTPGDITITP